MIKEAYFRGLMKVAQVQPNMAQKLWRGLTSSSTESKVTRALLAGLPAAAVSKLLGLGWGTSAAIGAGSAGAAWYAPKLSKRYRLQEAARDKGVPAQMLDRLYYADTKVNGVNQLIHLRNNIIRDAAQQLAQVEEAKRQYAEASPQKKREMQQQLRDLEAGSRAVYNINAPVQGFNASGVAHDSNRILVHDIRNNTSRLKAFYDLLKYK